jgi:hypothetical protein
MLLPVGLLDDAARCTCTSRTPRPALTALRHDATAALSGEWPRVALLHRSMSKVLVRPSTQPHCATRLHARRRDGAHRGRRFVWLPLHYRFTYATRLDVCSTTHRCVEWPCFTDEAKSVLPSRDCTEEEEEGSEKGADMFFFWSDQA